MKAKKIKLEYPVYNPYQIEVICGKLLTQEKDYIVEIKNETTYLNFLK